MAFVAEKTPQAKTKYLSRVESKRTRAYLDLFKVLKDKPYYCGGEFQRK
jgi:hypothetical protein